MVDWRGSKNVTGKTCFLAPSFLLLIEEKKQKKIKASTEAGEIGRIRDDSETCRGGDSRRHGLTDSRRHRGGGVRMDSYLFQGIEGLLLPAG